MTLPTFEGFAESEHGSSNSLTFVADVPTSTVEDDLLIMMHVCDGTNIPDLLSGWTDIHNAGSLNGGSVSWRISRRLAPASPPSSYTFSVPTTGQKHYGIMSRISGYDPANIIDVVSTLNEGTSQSPACNAATTTVDDCLILRFFGADDQSITVPDSGTPLLHTMIASDDTQGSGFGEVAGGAARQNQASAGSTGTATWITPLSSSEPWGAITIAVAGISGGGGGVSHLANTMQMIGVGR